MVTLSAMGLSGQLFWGLSSRWPECKCRVRAAWSRGGGWYFPQLMRIPVSQLDTQQPWERLRDIKHLAEVTASESRRGFKIVLSTLKVVLITSVPC